MRIHRLELTAFGPFPDTEVVEFDRFNDAGLFLLTGPTGAGKTSILDAICLALYGGVPGDRNGAKAFKSDHAAADVAPSVVLDLTVRGRRLRLRRQPGWSRPSRRARSGVVEEKTKASIEELDDGTWRALSTRVDEVGHLVTTLLGMNKDQFCQVVMLPQGAFQTFLSAGAKERHDVLESLFRTHRFQAIERWLADHRRGLDTACRGVEAGLERLLARADEVLSTSGLPAAPHDQGDAASASFTYPAALDDLRLHLAALVADAGASAEESLSASEDAKQAQHAFDAARSLLDLQRRHREAQNRRDELASSAAEVRRREREVLLARRAGAFEPLLDLVAQADRDREAARLTLEQATRHAWFPRPDSDLSTFEAVETLAQDLRNELARLDALSDVERDLVDTRRELDALGTAVASTHAAESELVTRSAHLPDELERAHRALAEAQTAQALLPKLDDEVRATAVVRDAADRAVDAAARLLACEATLLEARELRADVRELQQAVRERRIAGMAAHLADGLTAGEPCPVCGSAEHPRPARATQDGASEQDEAAAAARVEHADHAVGQAELQRARLLAERTAADHAAGGLTPDQAATALEDAVRRRAEVAETAATAPVHADAVRALQQTQEAVLRKLETTREALHTQTAQHAEKAAAADRVRTRLESAIGSGTTLTAARAVISQRLSSTEALGLALRDDAEAAEALQAATQRLDRLVADSVFATVGQVRDAVRSEADIASGEALNRAYAAEKAATERTLADPTLVRAMESPTPDLEVLRLTAEQAAATAGLASTRSGRTEAAAARLETLVAELAVALEEWSPLREQRDLAEHVASMVAGTSKDNTSKTKLSHYVLAARLEQVVAAANIRLAGICAGRYELEHTLSRGVGDARGGLGLRVLDTYTGARRDPATLSGGETFYVSLALALGLADLVNNEIGGAELSTLFVDEGFGSLDAETLDEVMDELDALRSGGRSVGLVSHLAELRTRVPAQLSVVRSPHGSRLDDSR